MNLFPTFPRSWRNCSSSRGWGVWCWRRWMGTISTLPRVWPDLELNCMSRQMLSGIICLTALIAAAQGRRRSSHRRPRYANLYNPGGSGGR